MSATPTKKFCSNCDGAGCRKCALWGWVWSDGEVPEECRPGVACGRVAQEQCATCPMNNSLAKDTESDQGD